ncbi:MAG: ATP-binding protein, partial [Pseudomonadota bacterium]
PDRAGQPPRRAAAQAVVFTLDGGLRLLVGRDLQEQDAFQRLIGAALVARTVRRRLGALRAAAEEIVSGERDRRMPITGVDDEFDRLAAVLNRMLDRLDGLMDGFQTIADDVAHDLRSPLSRLRARLEVALMGDADAAAYRAALEETVGEVENLLAVFNAVAKIAHLEAGAAHLDAAPIDLAAIARDAGDLYAPVLEDAGLSLTIAAQSPAPAHGDRALLGQALANLLDNAAAYAAPAGSRVVVTAGPGLLSVADDGPGVPAEHRVRATERRARLDASRSRVGAGLGLSLAAAAARAHGGALSLEDGLDGRGLTARITLPDAA